MVNFFKKIKCLLAAFGLFFFTFSLLAQENGAEIFPDKPVPAKFVHDYAGWLTPDEQVRLEQKLARYSDSTSTQIVVMIRKDIGDYDKSGYAIELLNRWGIGRQGKNNGIVLLIKSEAPDRGIFIATGYGVEGALPDILAARISRDIIIPQFKNGNNYQGLDEGTTAIIQALSGEFKAKSKDQQGIPIWVIFLVFIIVFIVFSWISRKRNGMIYSDKGVSRRSGAGWGNAGGWWMGSGGGGNSGGWGGGSDSGWGGGGGDSFGGGFGGGGGAGGDW